MTKIYNVPAYAKSYNFIVARKADDGNYWFWGAWEKMVDAGKAAEEINGRVFFKEDCEFQPRVVNY